MDAELFRDTYARYGSLVWFVIGKAGVPERDREDVFMETWEAIFSSRQSFSGRSGIASWIGRIARNKAVDRVRKNIPLPLDGPELIRRAESGRSGTVPGPDREVVRGEAGELLKKFLRGLPRERRFIIERWLEGLSYREIAARATGRTGRKADTNYVGKEIYLAKTRLAELLSEAGISSLEDIWE